MAIGGASSPAGCRSLLVDCSAQHWYGYRGSRCLQMLQRICPSFWLFSFRSQRDSSGGIAPVPESEVAGTSLHFDVDTDRIRNVDRSDCKAVGPHLTVASDFPRDQSD